MATVERRCDDLVGPVVDIALDELCSLFHLDGVAMASVPPGRPLAEPDLVLCLPREPELSPQVRRSLDAHLLALLQPNPRIPVDGRSGEMPVAGRTLWLHRVRAPGWSISVAAVRIAPFDFVERRSLEAVTGALGLLIAGPPPGPGLRQAMAERSSITLKAGVDGEVVAELVADWPLPPRPLTHPDPGRRAGVGRGPNPVEAVGGAAAKASRPRCGLVFAGSEVVGGRQTALTVVEGPDRRLRIGLAQRAPGDLGAVVEAVFAAGLAGRPDQGPEPTRT